VQSVDADMVVLVDGGNNDVEGVDEHDNERGNVCEGFGALDVGIASGALANALLFELLFRLLLLVLAAVAPIDGGVIGDVDVVLVVMVSIVNVVWLRWRFKCSTFIEMRELRVRPMRILFSGVARMAFNCT
jgi:hypothetical protein